MSFVLIRSAHSARRMAAWTFSSTAPAPSYPTRRARDLPGSWRILVSLMPCSSTPRSVLHQAIRCSTCCFPLRKQCQPPELFRFGAQSHGLAIPCVRFAAGVAPCHATLGSGWLPTFAGQAFGLLDPTRDFDYVIPSHSVPLLQALPGALSAETLPEYGDVPADDPPQVEDGPVLCAETVRRIACDSAVVRMVETAKSEPLDVGRKTRVIPWAIRRALKRRDGGCRFPSCTNTRFVEGHHVVHWADGGETRLSNLVSLCRHHHRLLHEGGYHVVPDGDDFIFCRGNPCRGDRAHHPAV